ncbi:hypothetical protein QUH73_18660 [Labilibaculum sp. K2S]|uniref:hypothetical protein n=1 Tax=Labilibaculum sp. K2S TaxID=3056386 RepID=UPI0025A4B49B|nr:hypothetical protein [Labilibaculum sp. K2S]MDM8161845.1 hypothetical protein [Labilibaculum sp. K2S]
MILLSEPGFYTCSLWVKITRESKTTIANVNYSGIVLRENVLADNETEIYPNPTKGKLIIEIDRNQNYSVFNSAGILVKNGRIGREANEISLIVLFRCLFH